jgi:hypothetical protein
VKRSGSCPADPRSTSTWFAALLPFVGLVRWNCDLGQFSWSSLAPGRLTFRARSGASSGSRCSWRLTIGSRPHFGRGSGADVQDRAARSSVLLLRALRWGASRRSGSSPRKAPTTTASVVLGVASAVDERQRRVSRARPRSSRSFSSCAESSSTYRSRNSAKRAVVVAEPAPQLRARGELASPTRRDAAFAALPLLGARGGRSGRG